MPVYQQYCLHETLLRRPGLFYGHKAQHHVTQLHVTNCPKLPDRYHEHLSIHFSKIETYKVHSTINI